MTQSSAKTNITKLAVVSSLIVGVINVASVYAVYSYFIEDAENIGEIARIENTNSSGFGSTGPNAADPDSTFSDNGNSGGGQRFALNSNPNPNNAVGSQPNTQPQTSTQGGTAPTDTCNDRNPDLPNEVCEAIKSAVSNPTSSNPQIGDKALRALTLLPGGTNLSMDESSWESTSPTSGTMIVTLHTFEYGDMLAKLFLVKENNIWIVDDGQLV